MEFVFKQTTTTDIDIQVLQVCFVATGKQQQRDVLRSLMCKAWAWSGSIVDDCVIKDAVEYSELGKRE